MIESYQKIAFEVRSRSIQVEIELARAPPQPTIQNRTTVSLKIHLWAPEKRTLSSNFRKLILEVFRSVSVDASACYTYYYSGEFTR